MKYYDVLMYLRTNNCNCLDTFISKTLRTLNKVKAVNRVVKQVDYDGADVLNGATGNLYSESE